MIFEPNAVSTARYLLVIFDGARRLRTSRIRYSLFGGMDKPVNLIGFFDQFPITLTVTEIDWVLGLSEWAGPGFRSEPSLCQPIRAHINITIAKGKVDSSGKKIDVSVGQEVILQITSDQDHEIHAHTGGNGYELQVKAGQPTTGTLIVPSPGSFEVERTTSRRSLRS
jgi:hypothetical protein